MEGIEQELMLINKRLDVQRTEMEEINMRLLNMEQNNKIQENIVKDKRKKFIRRDIRNDQLTYMGCSNNQFQIDSFSSSSIDTQLNDTALTELRQGVSLPSGGFMKTTSNLCLCLCQYFKHGIPRHIPNFFRRHFLLFPDIGPLKIRNF